MPAAWRKTDDSETGEEFSIGSCIHSAVPKIRLQKRADRQEPAFGDDSRPSLTLGKFAMWRKSILRVGNTRFLTYPPINSHATCFSCQWKFSQN